MDKNTFEQNLYDALTPMIGKPAISQEIYDLVRTAIPKSIARDILGIQPMDTGVFYAPYIPLQFYEKDTRVFTKKPMNFSRAKWYRVDVEPQDWEDALDWAKEQFGQKPKNPDAWSRWYTGLCSITFRDEKDYNWFILRWGA